MNFDVRYRDLLVEAKIRLGSVRRLAERLRVAEKTAQEWLKKNEDDLRRSRTEHLEAIESLARDLGIEVESYRNGPALWEPRNSYNTNILAPLPDPPQPVTPAKNHSLSFLGFRVNSPVGVSSSVLTATADHIQFFSLSGADVITYKTVRPHNYRAKLPPNMYVCSPAVGLLDPDDDRSLIEVEVEDEADLVRSMQGLVNRFNQPSPAPEVWQADFRAARASLKAGQLLILSVASGADAEATDDQIIAGYLRVIELAVQAGATVIELNLGCPNAGGRQSNVFASRELVVKICKKVREAGFNTKLLLKIRFMIGEALRSFVLETAPYCNGYSAINAVPVLAHHVGQEGSEPVFGQSGQTVALSGKPILRLGLRCVQELARIREQERLKGIAIIGMGGVTSEQDFIAYLNSGADIVQVATACLADSYFPFKLRKFYDSQARNNETSAHEEQEVALVNHTKACRLLERELSANPRLRAEILAASQAEMFDWLGHYERTLALGPRRAKEAPSVDECKSAIQQRLLKNSGSRRIR